MNLKAQEAIWAFGPRKIAGQLNITDGAIYAWLRGKSKPRYDVAQKLITMLEPTVKLEISDLMAEHQINAIRDRRTVKGTHHA